MCGAEMFALRRERCVRAIAIVARAFPALNALRLATLVMNTSGILPRSLHILSCDNTKRLRKGAATNRSIPLLSARRFASFPR